MIRKVLWFVFAALVVIASVIKVIFALLGFILVLVAWLI